MSLFTFVPEEVSVPRIKWAEITKEFDDPEHRRKRRVLDTGSDRIIGLAYYSVGKGHDRVELDLTIENEKVKENETQYVLVVAVDENGDGEFHRISRTGKTGGNFYEAYSKTQGNVTTHRCDASFNGAWQTKEVKYSLKLGFGYSFTILTANGVVIYRHRSPCKDALRSIKVLKGVIHTEASEALVGIFSSVNTHSFDVTRAVVDGVEAIQVPRMFEWARNVVYLNLEFLKEVDRDFVMRDKPAEDFTQMALSPVRTRTPTRFSPVSSPSRGKADPTFHRETRGEVSQAAETILSMSDKDTGLSYDSIEDKAEVVANFDSFIEKNDLNVVLNFVEIPNLKLLESSNPLFMLKEDAYFVNANLKAIYEREFSGRKSFSIDNFIVCFLQILLTFSTCWPLQDTSTYNIEVGIKGVKIIFDFKKQLKQVFSNSSLDRYTNPLRQYSRYWSTTVISFIKRGILVPNYAVMARHGVCKEHIPYCFDFVVMDARYNSKSDKIGSILARETALRNKGSRRRMNLILSLYDRV